VHVGKHAVGARLSRCYRVREKIGIACALLIMVLAAHHCLGISVVGEEQLRLVADLREKVPETASLTSGNYRELTWPATRPWWQLNKLYCSSGVIFDLRTGHHPSIRGYAVFPQIFQNRQSSRK